MEDNKKELEDFKGFIRLNQQMAKGIFGLVFWQILEVLPQMSPDDLANEGINLKLTDSDDEFMAVFISSFIKFWRASGDFYATSRFVADCIGMTANELIEAKMFFEQQWWETARTGASQDRTDK